MESDRCGERPGWALFVFAVFGDSGGGCTFGGAGAFPKRIERFCRQYCWLKRRMKLLDDRTVGGMSFLLWGEPGAFSGFFSGFGNEAAPVFFRSEVELSLDFWFFPALKLGCRAAGFSRLRREVGGTLAFPALKLGCRATDLPGLGGKLPTVSHLRSCVRGRWRASCWTR